MVCVSSINDIAGCTVMKTQLIVMADGNTNYGTSGIIMVV